MWCLISYKGHGILHNTIDDRFDEFRNVMRAETVDQIWALNMMRLISKSDSRSLLIEVSWQRRIVKFFHHKKIFLSNVWWLIPFVNATMNFLQCLMNINENLHLHFIDRFRRILNNFSKIKPGLPKPKEYISVTLHSIFHIDFETLIRWF
jgi:hypothetical protein